MSLVCKDLSLPKFPIIILAGGEVNPELLPEYTDLPYKSFIKIKGVSMLERVFKAIYEANIGTYYLFAGIEDKELDFLDKFDNLQYATISVTGKIVDKIEMTAKHVLEKSKTDPDIFQIEQHHALLFTTDIPAITPEAICDYVLRCKKLDQFQSEFYYGIVKEERMDQVFPENGRSYVKLQEGKVCGADLTLIDLDIIQHKVDLIKKLTENRKSFFKALLVTSPFTIIRYLFNRIDIKRGEELMTKIFGINSKLILSNYPQIAFDVDKSFQLEKVKEYITNQEN